MGEETRQIEEVLGVLPERVAAILRGRVLSIRKLLCIGQRGQVHRRQWMHLTGTPRSDERHASATVIIRDAGIADLRT